MALSRDGETRRKQDTAKAIVASFGGNSDVRKPLGGLVSGEQKVQLWSSGEDSYPQFMTEKNSVVG